jgi:hypothetical protein
MGVTDISARTTKHINDFSSHQNKQVAQFADNLADFRAQVLLEVSDVCKAAFADSGFQYDDYSR